MTLVLSHCLNQLACGMYNYNVPFLKSHNTSEFHSYVEHPGIPPDNNIFSR